MNGISLKGNVMKYTSPTPEEIDTIIRRAHRMRSEAFAGLVRNLFRSKASPPEAMTPAKPA